MVWEEYGRKLVGAEQAVSVLSEGELVFVGPNSVEPPALLEALESRLRCGDLKGIRTFHLHPFVHACRTILSPDLSDCVEAYTAFVSPGERGLVAAGLNLYVPNHYHQLPRLIREHMDVGAVMTVVSPMDDEGYFTFGTANDYITTAAKCAKTLIVEVNRNMARVLGEPRLHISEVDFVVEHDAPVVEYPMAEPGPVDEEIGRIVAEMVPDGATVQLGWGNVPSAVARCLENHKDLGVHTEVFGEAYIPLIEKGAATGAKKTLLPGKHVFTCAAGGRRMMDFLDGNPDIESRPVDFTNNPAVIAKNRNMVSINAVLEVDLTGQCNAEFLEGRQYSGTGGQLDYVRGAYAAEGGVSILAFHSTAKGGQVSRVVPSLGRGTMVTTPRMDTHWVVTEHGAANLKGRSTRDRALALIGLAHPDFRDELLRAAEDMRLL